MLPQPLTPQTGHDRTASLYGRIDRHVSLAAVFTRACLTGPQPRSVSGTRRRPAFSPPRPSVRHSADATAHTHALEQRRPHGLALRPHRPTRVGRSSSHPRTRTRRRPCSLSGTRRRSTLSLHSRDRIPRWRNARPMHELILETIRPREVALMKP